MNLHQNEYVSQPAQKGQLWTQGEGEALLRVLEFSGVPVPEDGLVVSPPSGGTLTVWPNGMYEFTPQSEGETLVMQDPVSTFYGYVAEDLYGEIVAGSFVLAGGEDSPVLMQDFQAWSLPELMDVEGAAEALLHVGHLDALDNFAHGVSDSHHADALAGPDPAIDDLARLIIDSQNS